MHSNEVNLICYKKGSIIVNGIILAVVVCAENGFSVCIIRYAWKKTSFNDIENGIISNLEFDIVWK